MRGLAQPRLMSPGVDKPAGSRPAITPSSCTAPQQPDRKRTRCESVSDMAANVLSASLTAWGREKTRGQQPAPSALATDPFG